MNATLRRRAGGPCRKHSNHASLKARHGGQTAAIHSDLKQTAGEKSAKAKRDSSPRVGLRMTSAQGCVHTGGAHNRGAAVPHNRSSL